MKTVIPKKSLGQHWLHDAATLQAIADSAEITKDDIILEIGPGQGTLTKYLLAEAKQVIAIELDPYLANGLSRILNQPQNPVLTSLEDGPHKEGKDGLVVVLGDVLSFDLSQLPQDYKVVANIPYYLTAHLLRMLCESSNPPKSVVLLVQKEVAERVAAPAGQSSLLSVSVQYYCDVELGQVVPAALFTPPPKIDSQVLILRYRGPKFKDVNRNEFFRIVKAGYAGRRKKLRSSLSGGLRITKEESDALLLKAGVNGNLRAQNLSLDDWHKLYRVLS